MSNHIQTDFNGGINFLYDSSQLEDNQYVLGVNLRVRDELMPIKKSIKLKINSLLFRVISY